jgi:hypothetical protein
VAETIERAREGDVQPEHSSMIRADFVADEVWQIEARRTPTWSEKRQLNRMMADLTITRNEHMRQRFIHRGAYPARIGIVMGSADEMGFRSRALSPRRREPGTIHNN